MAISVLDVRDTPAASGFAPETTPARAVHRRLPAAVAATAVISVVEAVALLAASLTGLGGLLNATPAPDGLLVAFVLGSLASWIVACAGGAATMVDGVGRRLVQWVAYGEMVLVAVLFVIGVLTPDLDALVPDGLPLPAFALLSLAVPVGKLLLAGSPTTLAFLATGPRPRERRPDPTKVHQGICVATLAVIGVVLGAVAVLAPADGAGAGGSTSAVSSTH